MDFGAYVIFTKTPLDRKQMIDNLIHCIGTEVETPADEIVLLNKCNNVNMWHLCIRKSLIATMRERAEEVGLRFSVYRVGNQQVPSGYTYAFYVPRGEETFANLTQLLESLDGKFIRPESYQIHQLEKSLIVAFSKNNDVYPKRFIKTLKAILNGHMCGNGEKLSVRWCRHGALQNINIIK